MISTVQYLSKFSIIYHLLYNEIVHGSYFIVIDVIVIDSARKLPRGRKSKITT